MQPASQEQSNESNVVSPFAQSAATLPSTESSPGKLILWVVIAFVVIGVGGVGGMMLAKHLSDPLCTLEKFPVAKYLENHRAVAGARFKGELRVEADLGWKESFGRLMVFTTPEDSRPIVVMVPAHLSNIYFSKGQTYLAELEVKEGGLIYANTCRKN